MQLQLGDPRCSTVKPSVRPCVREGPQSSDEGESGRERSSTQELDRHGSLWGRGEERERRERRESGERAAPVRLDRKSVV